jgi:hypothetical protein
VTDGRSLEGWAPEPGGEASLEEIVEHAFDYRGDVTLVLADGREVTGYVYNRDRDADDPFLQIFLPSGARVTFRHAEVRAIRFTGKDTAAGKSYLAWLERKSATRGA